MRGRDPLMAGCISLRRAARRNASIRPPSCDTAPGTVTESIPRLGGLAALALVALAFEVVGVVQLAGVRLRYSGPHVPQDAERIAQAVADRLNDGRQLQRR
jgi:hypothetical protein